MRHEFSETVCTSQETTENHRPGLIERSYESILDFAAGFKSLHVYLRERMDLHAIGRIAENFPKLVM